LKNEGATIAQPKGRIMLLTLEIAQFLNGLGLICGMVGTALIYFFGVPRQIDTGGIVTLSLEGDQRCDTGEQQRISRFRRWGNIGLGSVFAAFCLQLIALMLG
jgi:hypothetical protein